MSDVKPVDGDDYTDDWWMLLRDTGHFTVGADGGLSYNDNVHQTTQTLYGTMTGGDVAGLSLVDVPPVYNTKTHAERTDNALWHIGRRLAELADEVRDLRQRIDDMTADS